jgi:hypothetical protein
VIWLLACTNSGPEGGEAPGYRYSHVGALDAADERLLITGGSSEEGRRVDAWAYDLASGDWTELGEPPETMFRSTLVARGDEAWVFAGSGEGSVESDRLWHWDMSADRWTARSEGPPGRYKAAAVRIEDTMLVHGGRFDDEGETLTRQDLWWYDLDGDSWTELSIEGGPGPMTRQALIWDEDAGLVWLSGGIDDTDTRHSWLWTLDLDTETWTLVADDDQGAPVQASHSFWRQDSDALCTWAGAGSDHDIWCYSIRAATWSPHAGDGPVGRDAQVFDVAGDGIAWMMGGDPHDDEGYPNFTNDVWSLELSSLSWTARFPVTP